MEPDQLLSTTRTPQRSLYARSSEEVARSLLGGILVRHRDTGILAGRIVEVEAYLGADDPAAHSSAGLTPRTRAIFGAPGHAYVYRVYGMHHCLNVVAEPAGVPGCVLIRAIEPLCGIVEMQSRRPAARRVHDLANGPGKLTQALDIGMGLYGTDLIRGPLTVRMPDAATEPIWIETSPRIGISKAKSLDLRFFIANNEFVSRR